MWERLASGMAEEEWGFGRVIGIVQSFVLLGVQIGRNGTDSSG